MPQPLPDQKPSPASAQALDSDAAYRALQTRDARFDGRIFVGVTSTGVYCRPVCRVRMPKRENCRFFPHAAGAEKAGFRPCLRCRPELAPGLALSDSPVALARAGARFIEHAVAQGEPLPLSTLANRLGITDRHFRRVFQLSYGVSPLQWLATQRLLLAKRLLTDTGLPVTEVASACGFASLRRFHAAFAEHYRLTPGSLRKVQRNPLPVPSEAPHTLSLPWRPPFDAAGLFAFFGARPLAAVEQAGEGLLCRSLALSHRGQTHRGWLSIRLDEASAEVRVSVSASLAPGLGAVLARVRHLLDLDADTAPISEGLRSLPVPVTPGLRLPGCMDGFETTVRIILGQQVSVAAACTLAARLVARWGEPIETPWPGVNRLFPTPECLATAAPETLGELGIVRSRIGAIQGLARAVASGQLELHPAAPLEATLAALQQIPGIGPWTTELVAMRVLAWPDAFPSSDAGLIRALGGLRHPASTQLADAWRPWRSYAVVQLWQSLNAPSSDPAAPPDTSTT